MLLCFLFIRLCLTIEMKVEKSFPTFTRKSFKYCKRNFYVDLFSHFMKKRERGTKKDVIFCAESFNSWVWWHQEEDVYASRRDIFICKINWLKFHLSSLNPLIKLQKTLPWISHMFIFFWDIRCKQHAMLMSNEDWAAQGAYEN
jgi:hypothetical protein